MRLKVQNKMPKSKERAEKFHRILSYFFAFLLLFKLIDNLFEYSID
jgi:hypothetical protein